MTSLTRNPISVFITTIIIVHTQSGSDRKILDDMALASVEETCSSHWLVTRSWV